MPPAPLLVKNPTIQDTIVDALRAGNTIEAAAGHARTTATSVHSWLARGRAEATRLASHPGARPKASEAVFLTFLENVEGAIADAECRVVAQIQNAIPVEWRAGAWWLERRHRMRWGREDRVAHVGDGGGPISVEVTVSARDELVARLDIMRQRLTQPILEATAEED